MGWVKGITCQPMRAPDSSDGAADGERLGAVNGVRHARALADARCVYEREVPTVWGNHLIHAFKGHEGHDISLYKCL